MRCVFIFHLNFIILQKFLFLQIKLILSFPEEIPRTAGTFFSSFLSSLLGIRQESSFLRLILFSRPLFSSLYFLLIHRATCWFRLGEFAHLFLQKRCSKSLALDGIIIAMFYIKSC